MRTSLIGFANRYPLTLGLERGEVDHPFETVVGTPREIARGWKKGLFDAGLLSVGALLDMPYAQPLMGWGISARGPVMSVGVFSDRPWSALGRHPIRNLSSGVTTPLLLRVLWEKAFGREPNLLSPGDPRKAPSVLAIGDQALRWREEGRFPFFEDLGTRWATETGTAMPFAFWCLRDRSDAHARAGEVEEALWASWEWGQSNPSDVAKAIESVAGVGPRIVKQYLKSYQVKLAGEEEDGWHHFKEAASPILRRIAKRKG
ncbi:hypothetical protein H8D30_00285 [bacterium]|nr:hypothetical protein [bacterium]